jgi:hypothetical protein
MVPGVTGEMTTGENHPREVRGEAAASGDMTMRSRYLPKASANRLAPWSMTSTSRRGCRST